MAALLLTAILFRALIPAGFMPVFAADGAFTLQLCPGTISSPAASVGEHTQSPLSLAGEQAAHAHHEGGGSEGQAVQHLGLCPFAATASPAPVPAILGISYSAADWQRVQTRRSTEHSVPSIIRAQLARAPPHLG